jgi:hypothetical protein
MRGEELVTIGATRPTTRAALIAVAASSALVLTARGGGQRQNAPAPASPQPTVGNAPVNAQQFVGQQVTLVKTVGQLLSPTAFILAPGGSGGVLVLSRTPVTATPGGSAQVTGTLMANYTDQPARRFGAVVPAVPSAATTTPTAPGTPVAAAGPRGHRRDRRRRLTPPGQRPNATGRPPSVTAVGRSAITETVFPPKSVR